MFNDFKIYGKVQKQLQGEGERDPEVLFVGSNAENERKFLKANPLFQHSAGVPVEGTELKLTIKAERFQSVAVQMQRFFDMDPKQMLDVAIRKEVGDAVIRSLKVI